jgi:circadian clock protein KaiC
MTIERVTTGIPALDTVLHGGLPRFATVFVVGPPGSGKTVLCQQALFANARKAIPALYLGTLSEPVLKMIRHAQEFSFFVSDMVGKEIVFADLGDALKSGGLGILSEVDRLVKQHRPEFLVIDSFKVIREYFSDAVDFRRFIAEIVAKLAAWEVTALFVGEYTKDEILTEPEFAIADGIIYMYGSEEPERQKRFLRIMKMRGTDFFAGQHLFDITTDGIDLFPRLDPTIRGEYSRPYASLPSVIPGLNGMVGGGLGNSSCAIISGPAGAGKTSCAMSFLIGGAMAGIPGLFVSFEERPEQIFRNASQFDWQPNELKNAGVLEVIHISPSELDLDRHAVFLQKRALELGAGAIVIDTISALQGGTEGGNAHNYLWAIADYFKRAGTTLIMTYETPPEPRHHDELQSRLSFLADVMIDLNRVEVDGLMYKTISIAKMRGIDHDRATRELVMHNSTIAVGDVFRPRFAQ